MNTADVAAIGGSVLAITTSELLFEESSSSDDEYDEFVSILFLQRRNIMKVLNFDQVCLSMDDLTFQTHFRLTRKTYEIVRNEVDRRRVEKKRNINDKRPPISTNRALLLTVWILANQDSFREAGNLFNLSKGNSHSIFMDIIHIIVELADVYLKWPSTKQLNIIKEEFNSIGGRNSFPNVIGALDAKHIAIPAPKEDRQSYVNRKSFYSVNLQAICDSHAMFLDVFVGWPGSSHDSRVWRNSPISDYLEQPNVIPNNTHIVADSAYPLKPYLMCPFRDNHHLTRAQKNFNTKLSVKRAVIERAFGLLTARFRRLKFLNMSNVKEIPNVIIACCVLHNICIKYNDSWENDKYFDIAVDDNEDFFDDPDDILDAHEKRNAILHSLM